MDMTIVKRNKGLELLTTIALIILALYSIANIVLLGMVKDLFPSSLEEVRQGYASFIEIAIIIMMIIAVLLNTLFSVLSFLKLKALKKGLKGNKFYLALLFFSALGFILCISIPLLQLASIGYALLFIISIICLYVTHKGRHF